MRRAAPFAVAVLVSACGAAPPAGDGATLEQAMGCWALTWGEAAAEAPELFPDRLVFTTDAYVPHFEWEGLDTRGMRAARAVRDDTASTEWTWKRMWRGEMWWHVVAHDSVRFGMGHDGSEFVGFTAAVSGNALSGTGTWTSDMQPDTHLPLRAERIVCP
jgi:hypothetical protein